MSHTFPTFDLTEDTATALASLAVHAAYAWLKPALAPTQPLCLGHLAPLVRPPVPPADMGLLGGA